jgi:tetratricopeptide (TPR) repeat protein
LRFAQLLAAEEMRQGAYREAAEFLRMCLVLSNRTPLELGSVDHRIRWNRELSEATIALGDAAQSRTYAETAAGLAGVRVRRNPWRAAAQTTWAVLLRALPLSGRRLRVTRTATPVGIERELARIFRQLAYSAYFASDSGWFVHYSLRALAHAERAHHGPELVQTMATAGSCMGYLGLHRTCRRYINAAAELGRQVTSHEAVSSAHMVSGLYFVGCGDWDNTQKHVDACQLAARSGGNNLEWGSGQAVRFWMHWYRGQDSEAERAANELLTQAERTGNRQHRSWAQRFLALVARRQGQLEVALTRVETAERLLGNHLDFNEAMQVAGLHASVLSALGRVDDAETLARQTIDRLQGSARPTGHAMIESCTGLCDVLLDAYAKRPRDVRSRQRVLSMLQALGRISSTFPVGRSRHHHACAQYWAIVGKKRKVVRHKRLALLWARKLGMQADVRRISEESQEMSG